MPVGIIAEYNPFHKGHAFHLSETRKKIDEPIVAVLSSNFTQRGIPAFCDKWSRTEMALQNGISLVIELPTFFSCNGGFVFAQAVDILNALGISHISFGVEDSEALDIASSILSQEPLSFKQTIGSELAKGASFSKAISNALETEVKGLGIFASMPNNSLALSYISYIKRKGYMITPLPVKRGGLGHHASASKIRNAFGEDFDCSELSLSTRKILLKCKNENRIFSEKNYEKLFEFLRVAILCQGRGVLREVDGVSEGIEGLFLKNIRKADSFDDFIGRCVCARYTRSKLQRLVIRILLGIDRWIGLGLRRLGPPYVRVLGCDCVGRKILREASKFSGIEIITKLASVTSKLGRECANMEFKASDLWEMLVGGKRKEEKSSPILK